MKPMNVEQILHLMLGQAVEEAPSAPGVEWFLDRLPPRTAETTSGLEPWWKELPERWREVWQALRVALPAPLNLSHRTPELHSVAGDADTGEIIAEQQTPVLGTIPASVLRADRVVEAKVEAMRKPAVARDGRLLILRVRVPESGFHAGESAELVLLAVPEGQPLGSPWLLPLGQEARLAVALPSELEDAWRGFNDLEWENLPIRFILRPSSGTTEVAEGEAASYRGWLSDVFKTIGRLFAPVRSILGVCRARNGAKPTTAQALSWPSEILAGLVGFGTDTIRAARTPAAYRGPGSGQDGAGEFLELGKYMDRCTTRPARAGTVGAVATRAGLSVQDLARLGPVPPWCQYTDHAAA